MLKNNKPWFVLIRHDEPEPVADPAPDPAPPEGEPSDTDPPADPPPAKPGRDLEAEVAKWKALARKHEGNSKTNAEAAKKLAEIEDAQKTEAEKLLAARDAAEAKAAAAIERAVAAEIKVLASAAEFADPTDAEGAIRPKDFVDANGDIDVEGIKTRLAELLEAKPHWRKATVEPPKPKTPKPDPGQGARGGTGEVDFRTASKEEFTAELAKYGLTPRT